MKKKTIIIGIVALALAMLITALCINLFGFRTKAVNGINHIRWNIDCESISVEAALHAIMGNTQGIDVLDEIMFPNGAYVDDYNAKISIIRNDLYDEKSYSYEIHITLPKEQTSAFIAALSSANFTEEYRASADKQWGMYIPQSFGALSSDQLTYVFERLYSVEHPSYKGTDFAPTTGIAYIYIVESEGAAEVVIAI